MRLEHDRSISEATALGVASGITEDSNSLKAYVDSMTKEARREEDYTIQNGETAAGASKLAGMFGAAGDLGAGIFSFGAANNWFKTPTIK